jgi:mannan endo-1,4-beta-mannosidase
MLAAVPAIGVSADAIRLSVSDAQVKGGTLRDGIVTEFSGNDAEIRWRFAGKAGIYQARIYTRASSEKGYGLEVNGRSSGGIIKPSGDFTWQDAGLVELKDGENTAAILRGWGYYDTKGIEFVPAVIPKVRPVSGKLVTPNPTKQAQDVMNRLSRDYGKRTWSGQYEQEDVKHVQAKVGVTPAIFGADFMDASPSRLERGTKQRPPISELVATAKSGMVLTLSWHWNAPSKLKDTKEQPWYKGFYKDATDFDVAAALSNPDSEDYRLLIRDMDVIAGHLKQLQAAGVPVLWRPLHEAEGGWFWWGAKGAEPCKKLWRLMYDRYTRVHGLRNLIWVWNSSSPDWYPGDDTVDIVAIDRYPEDRSDALTGDWTSLLAQFDGKKMLAVGEFPGAPDVDRMARFGVHWAFFVSWTNDLGARGMKDVDLKRIYSSRRVVNRK